MSANEDLAPIRILFLLGLEAVATNKKLTQFAAFSLYFVKYHILRISSRLLSNISPSFMLGLLDLKEKSFWIRIAKARLRKI